MCSFFNSTCVCSRLARQTNHGLKRTKDYMLCLIFTRVKTLCMFRICRTLYRDKPRLNQLARDALCNYFLIDYPCSMWNNALWTRFFVSSPNYNVILFFFCTQYFDDSCHPCKRRRKHQTKTRVVLFFAMWCICVAIHQFSLLVICNEK